MIVVVVVLVVIVAVMVIVMSNACTCNDLPDLASLLRFFVVGGSVRVVLGAFGFEFAALGGPGCARAT